MLGAHATKIQATARIIVHAGDSTTGIVHIAAAIVRGKGDVTIDKITVIANPIYCCITVLNVSPVDAD